MGKLSLLVLALLLFTACDNFSRLQGTPPGSSARAEKSVAKNPSEQTASRFTLLQGSTRISPGREAPVILRIDSVTGASWVFNAEANRWVGVEDDLRRAGTYNSQTQKIEWGVKAPDGRDLNELSKEELIRYLSAAIRNGQSPNPKGPKAEQYSDLGFVPDCAAAPGAAPLVGSDEHVKQWLEKRKKQGQSK